MKVCANDPFFFFDYTQITPTRKTVCSSESPKNCYECFDSIIAITIFIAMKKRRDRQEKLHDSLINMLYAPPSPSPTPHDLTQFDEQTLDLAREIATSDHHRINTYEFEEEEEGRSEEEEEEEEGESGSQKLTRAQRKRLRKKKLKEVASNRRQIIGPQLPSTGDVQIVVGDGPEQQHSEGVRRNVTERGSEGGNDHTFIREETPSTIKVKHRRMSKKKARDKTMTTDDLCHEATSHDHQN